MRKNKIKNIVLQNHKNKLELELKFRFTCYNRHPIKKFFFY